MKEVGGGKNVRGITDHMGGGFGSKFGAGLEGQLAVRLAKMANAPVKFMLTRWDEQTANYRGPGSRAEIKLAAAQDGTLLASDVKTYNDGGPQTAQTPVDGGFYIIEPKARRAEAASVLTNTAGTAALRAPGHPQAAVIWDMALDEIAAKLNMDPLDFRRKNHADPVRVAEWEIGARVIGWDRRQKVPGSAPGVVKRGMAWGAPPGAAAETRRRTAPSRSARTGRSLPRAPCRTSGRAHASTSRRSWRRSWDSTSKT